MKNKMFKFFHGGANLRFFLSETERITKNNKQTTKKYLEAEPWNLNNSAAARFYELIFHFIGKLANYYEIFLAFLGPNQPERARLMAHDYYRRYGPKPSKTDRD